MNRSVTRPRRLLVLPTMLSALALFVAACGGGGAASTPIQAPTSQVTASPPAESAAQFEPAIVSTDLAVGPNRFVVGMLQGGALVIDARVHLRFFKIDALTRQATLVSETDAQSLLITRNLTYVHQDGKMETHSAGNVGVYVSQVMFDTPGNWGVEISGSTKDGKPIPPLTPLLVVREKSSSVGIGSPAPRTRQPLLSDAGGDMSRIDTSNPPDPEMHQVTIADAVTSGKPTVISFSSPGYCLSQTCGPTKDMVDQLAAKYTGRAHFIHVEPYDVPKARKGESLSPVPAMAEWGLSTEPWTFMVGRDGNVAAKFEGIVSVDELEKALSPLLS